MTAANGSSGRISVETVDKAAVASYTVSVQNTIVVTANSAFFGGASATFAPADANDKVTLTIAIADPCATTTVNPLVFKNQVPATVTTLAITDGASGSVTFSRPTTTTEDTTSRVKVCGETSMSIHSDASGANFSYTAGWAVITGPVAGVYTFTLDTTKDLSLIGNDASVTINVFIKAALDDYTSETR